ncbi:aromatic ring-hydroxylating dioxygenase subunit alpha [Salinisphaera sp. SPP-AMP-43]|uniref:aromatic ring-hydroxylating oxygenase subunit alpha n=1 Tax=Salinisphaera sp. SPP-AMP-43 TaxID=3121288 RepID=UPI003C6E6099
MSDEVLTPSIVDGLNAPVDQAICLPNEAYTSDDFLQREREQVFDPQWAFAAVGSRLPRRGDVFPVNVAGRPLVLTRDRDGSINAFHNVCRHRGLKLVEEGKRGCATLVCPYHAWTYALSGELKKTPHFGGPDCHDMEGFDRSQYGLMSVRCDVWNDLVFVNLSGDAPPLAEVMAPMGEHWANYDFSQLRHAASATFHVDTNWKLAIENFLESYHLPWTHPELNEFSEMSAHFSLLEPGFLGQGSRDYDSTVAGHPDLPLFPDLNEPQSRTAEYPYVGPNLMMGMHPSYFFVFSIQPDGSGRSVEQFEFYFVGDAAMTEELSGQRERVIEAWRNINDEDITMIEGMQRGRHSPGYQHGRFSPYHETTTHEFQRRLANRMAMHDVPTRAVAGGG